MMVFLVIFSPGLAILSTQGIHWRKIVLTWIIIVTITIIIITIIIIVNVLIVIILNGDHQHRLDPLNLHDENHAVCDLWRVGG